jgi:hypothetical protein
MDKRLNPENTMRASEKAAPPICVKPKMSLITSRGREVSSADIRLIMVRDQPGNVLTVNAT